MSTEPVWPHYSERELLTRQILDALDDSQRDRLLRYLLEDQLRDAESDDLPRSWTVFDDLAIITAAPRVNPGPRPHGVAPAVEAVQA